MSEIVCGWKTNEPLHKTRETTAYLQIVRNDLTGCPDSGVDGIETFSFRRFQFLSSLLHLYER